MERTVKNMTHDEFTALAKQFGFAQVYFTKPMCFSLGENRFNLVTDVKNEFPFTNSVIILVYPYEPFSKSERIPSYYLASNKAYHAGKALLHELNEHGIHAEKVDIPIKSQLINSGIGTKCRNSLVAIKPFGTRVVFVALAVQDIFPLEYHENASEPCGNCRLCMEACPTAAITETGFDITKCMRFHMGNAKHPDWVRNLQKTYMGCEICQYACRRNTSLASTIPSAEMQDAFDMKRLICGDASKARELVGRNMCSNGKLIAEAIAFAAKDGLFHDEIEAAEASPFEAVRDAVRYAKQICNVLNN